jgi:hypothetical protein
MNKVFDPFWHKCYLDALLEFEETGVCVILRFLKCVHQTPIQAGPKSIRGLGIPRALSLNRTISACILWAHSQRHDKFCKLVNSYPEMVAGQASWALCCLVLSLVSLPFPCFFSPSEGLSVPHECFSGLGFLCFSFVLHEGVWQSDLGEESETDFFRAFSVVTGHVRATGNPLQSASSNAGWTHVLTLVSFHLSAFCPCSVGIILRLAPLIIKRPPATTWRAVRFSICIWEGRRFSLEVLLEKWESFPTPLTSLRS